MATVRWRGDAAPVAQVTAWLFGGTWETTDVINCVIGNKTVSVVAGSTTISTIVDTIVTALNASTINEFEEITWSRSSNSLVGTADTAGLPFTCTLTTTETGGGAADAQTIDGAASSAGVDSTACSGPNFWSLATNWDTGAVPVNSDDVYIEGTSDILYGLAQTAVTLTSLNILSTFTGKIGSPLINEAGGYYEYRATYLAIKATSFQMPAGSGAGSGRLKIDFSSAQMTGAVNQTGTPLESGLESLLIKGTHASNALEVNKGSVGIAVFPGETAVIATLRQGYTSNIAGDTQVRCGSGVTLTTINQSGGTLETNSNITTVNKTGGTMTIVSGTVTTLNNYSGTVYYISTGTCTTAVIGGEGTLDFSRDMSDRTFTTTTIIAGGRINDPFDTVAWTNGILTSRCKLKHVDIDAGFNRTWTPS